MTALHAFLIGPERARLPMEGVMAEDPIAHLRMPEPGSALLELIDLDNLRAVVAAGPGGFEDARGCAARDFERNDMAEGVICYAVDPAGQTGEDPRPHLYLLNIRRAERRPVICVLHCFGPLAPEEGEGHA